MKGIVLHPFTESNVAQFTASPMHAVMLAGTHGVGKTYLAELLAAELLGIERAALASQAYYRLATADKGSISIETIRELQRFLQLKTPGLRPVRRIIIIEHAETMTIEAQNAFLKLLEEPPADTVMILTVASHRLVLPTILSRVQVIPVYAPSEADTMRFFSSQAQSEMALTQAYFLSGGLPGLVRALVAGESEHPLLGGVKVAKDILQKTLFERLALVEPLSKKKEEAVYALDALNRIAQTGLRQAAAKNDAAKLAQWQRVLKITTEAMNALAQSANTKLVLSDLMLKM